MTPVKGRTAKGAAEQLTLTVPFTVKVAVDAKAKDTKEQDRAGY